MDHEMPDNRIKSDHASRASTARWLQRKDAASSSSHYPLVASSSTRVISISCQLCVPSLPAHAAIHNRLSQGLRKLCTTLQKTNLSPLATRA